MDLKVRGAGQFSSLPCEKATQGQVMLWLHLLQSWAQATTFDLCLLINSEQITSGHD